MLRTPIIACVFVVTSVASLGANPIEYDLSELDHKIKQQLGITDVDSNNYVIFFIRNPRCVGVCRRQAEGFAELHRHFKSHRASVIGVTPGTLEDAKWFREQYNLPFQFVSDSARNVRNALGVEKDITYGPGTRQTLVYIKGKLRDRIYGIGSSQHSKTALEVLLKEVE